MDDKDPVFLAKERGISSHIFADTNTFHASLVEALAKSPPMALVDGERELPCYVIPIEKFYTPVCYAPPASRQVLLVQDQEANEWLLLGATWFAGISEMVLASHIYIDELQMIETAIKRISEDSRIRIDSSAEIRPAARKYHFPQEFS